MNGARILLLDDNREARWPLARVLRAEGARVTEADDGSDGLRLLERASFDLVIADVCMPQLGGFGLFSKLRFGSGDGDPLPFRDLPIILITGQVSRSELARGMDAGLDDFVPKPVDLDEFRARVRAAVRRGRAEARPRTRTHGDLADLSLSALAQALHLGNSSLRVCLRSGTAYGVLDFQRGRIAHASYTARGYQVQGDEAAMLVLVADEGTFEIEPLPDTAPRTVFSDTQTVLLRAAAQADESTCIATAADDAAAVHQERPVDAFDVAVDSARPADADSASVEFDLDQADSVVA